MATLQTTSITGSLEISSSNLPTGSALISVDGFNSRIFNVIDNSSGSLFKVTAISGIPILEVFSDNSINMGKYAGPAIKIPLGGQDIYLGSGSVMFITSSGFVGINTTSPSYLLDVSGSIRLVNDLFVNNGTFNVFPYQSNSSINFQISPSGTGAISTLTCYNSGSLALYSQFTCDSLGDAIIKTQANTGTPGNVYIQPGGVTTMTILESNNCVGINVFSPFNRLDVGGNISCSVITASLLLGTSSWANTSSYTLGGTSGGVTGGSTNYIPLWSSNTTLTSSVMSQDNGLIGINTTAPDSLMGVNGNLSCFSQLYLKSTTTNTSIEAADLFFCPSGSTSVSTPTNVRYVISLRNNTGQSGSSNGLLFFGYDGISFSNHIYFSYNSGSSPFTAMPQPVSIGTLNSPSNTFGVYGNMSIGTGYLTTTAPTNGLIIQGNVGIGNTNPLGILDLGNSSPSGNMKFFWYGQGGNTGYISGTGINLSSASNAMNFVIGGSTSAGSGTATFCITRGNGLYSGGYSTYTDLLMVDSRTGMVTIGANPNGIGTNLFTYTSSLNNVNSNIQIGSGPLNQYNLLIGSAWSVGSYNPIVQANDSGIIFHSGSSINAQGFVIAPWNNSTSGLRITGLGNVGIGTTSATVPLQVNGNTTTTTLTVQAETLLNTIPFITYDTASNTNPVNGPLKPGYGYVSAGKPLYLDEEFSTGLNSIFAYNNLGGTALSLTRSVDNTAPNESQFSIKVNYVSGSSNGVSPSLGGVCLPTPTRANATFIQRFRANIPLGYTLNFATNPQGNNSYQYWITSNVGTGKWEEYIGVWRCGNTFTPVFLGVNSNIGSGYSLNEFLTVVGGVLSPGFTASVVQVTATGSGGSVVSGALVYASQYLIPPFLNGIAPITGAAGTGGQFNLNYAGAGGFIYLTSNITPSFSWSLASMNIFEADTNNWDNCLVGTLNVNNKIQTNNSNMYFNASGSNNGFVFNSTGSQVAIFQPISSAGASTVVIASGGTNQNVGLYFTDFNTSMWLLYKDNNQNFILQDRILGGNILQVSSSGNLTLGTTGNGNVIITPGGTGNVGINISSPFNKLDIGGNISCSAITSSLFFGTSSWSNTSNALNVLNNYTVNNFTANGITNLNTTAITGALTVTVGITSSLYGTSSWAISASYLSGSEVHPITTQVVTYNIKINDYFIGMNISGATATLPTASLSTGHVYVIKNETNGNITLNAALSVNIDNLTSINIGSYGSQRVISDGIQYWTI